MKRLLELNRKTKLFPAALLALVGGSASAQTSLGTADAFNVFTFGNATVNAGEAEGGIAVGGTFNLTGYNTNIGHGGAKVGGSISGLKKTDNSLGTQSNIAIYVGNNLVVSNSPSANNGGDVYVFNTITPPDNVNQHPINLNGGGHIYTGSPAVYPTGYNYAVDTNVFTNQQTFSLNQAATLKTESAAGHGTIFMQDQNNWYIDTATQTGLTTSTGKLKFFEVSAAALATANGTNIHVQNLSANDTLVINVTGATLSKTFFSLVNDSANSNYANILWNFADATEIDINNRAFEGSLLAPNAFVDQNQLFEGNLIANTLTGHGFEDHFGAGLQFTGNLTVLGNPNTPNVPEPGALALLTGMGLSGAGVLFRRRRR